MSLFNNMHHKNRTTKEIVETLISKTKRVGKALYQSPVAAKMTCAVNSCLDNDEYRKTPFMCFF
jgi:hypothetical protein